MQGQQLKEKKYLSHHRMNKSDSGRHMREEERLGGWGRFGSPDRWSQGLQGAPMETR